MPSNLFFGLCLASFGCVHYFPAAVSTNAVGSQHEHPVDVVAGHSSAYYIGLLGPFGNDSLQAAVEDALSFRRASTLSNVYVDRRLICFPLCYFPIISRIDTMVYGTLVSYSGNTYLGQGYVTVDSREMKPQAITEEMLSFHKSGQFKELDKFIRKTKYETAQTAFRELDKKYQKDQASREEATLHKWLVQNEYIPNQQLPSSVSAEELKKFGYDKGPGRY